ncbi:MAG: ASKHA domain-containing protein [Candidatus Aminicenantaceae bacterium]
MHRTSSQDKKDNFEIEFFPFEIKISVAPGTSILNAIKNAQIPLKTTCGGKGTCGECVVQVLSGKYKSKKSAALAERLADKGYALACLTEIIDNCTVQLPQFHQLSISNVFDSQFFDDHKKDISGIYEVKPLVKKIDLQLPSPSLDDNYSDLKRIQRELQRNLGVDFIHCEYSVLKRMAYEVRKNTGKISVILFKSAGTWTIIDVEPKTGKKNTYGLACDIGTTSVAVHLVDLSNGKILNTASNYNQQIKCGEDIISRINYTQRPGGLQELHTLIIMTINNLVKKVTESPQVSLSDIYYASVSGNTTMIHLFLNLEPRHIREEPYVPTLNQAPFILSRDLGLKINNEGRIHCAPSVGSYVGGDITAGLLCTPILSDSERISLFIDIGTNGELVVGNRDWLMTCACSAGPAFEGSGIKCGMPATEGAIEQIKIKEEGNLEYRVINGYRPKGLCGSGLIDLLAELFVHGYIDRQGKLILEKAKGRIVEDETGLGFLLEQSQNCFWERDLIITENDIANLIRTKGAVFSACSLLLKNIGLAFDKIDALYIGGSFGQNLNIENAVRIGLLPDLERSKFHYLGNSSLLGAYLILLSDKNRTLVNETSEKMTYIELNTEPSYMSEFTGALFLPHTDMELFPSVKQLFAS